MPRTRKTNRDDEAGAAIAAGGYGCVFRPPIGSVANQARIDSRPYITKVMSKKAAKEEMTEVTKFLPLVKTIKNYEKYFLLDDIFLDENFGPLTAEDKIDFNQKCDLALPGITAKNVNTNLATLSALYIPDGGTSIQEVFRQLGPRIGTDADHVFGAVVAGMINVLKGAIIPMNKKGIVHNDLKGGNMLVANDSIYSAKLNVPDIKLIDWGLAKQVPDRHTGHDIVSNLPLQFNAPFSIILLNASVAKVIRLYSSTRIITGDINNVVLKGLAVELLDSTQTNIGEGHSGYISTLFDNLVVPFNNPGIGVFGISQKCVNSANLNFSYVVDYIADVLDNFMVIENKGASESYFLNIEAYYYNVYIYNCDIWGFLSSLLDYVMSIPRRLYAQSSMAQKITYILFKYCYSTKYASIRIPIAELLTDLNDLVVISRVPKAVLGATPPSSNSAASPKGSPPKIPAAAAAAASPRTLRTVSYTRRGQLVPAAAVPAAAASPRTPRTVSYARRGQNVAAVPAAAASPRTPRTVSYARRGQNVAAAASPKAQPDHLTSWKLQQGPPPGIPQLALPLKLSSVVSLDKNVISLPPGMTKCPKGYIKNKQTGKCHRKTQGKKAASASPGESPVGLPQRFESFKIQSIVSLSPGRTKCPKGYIKNKTTGKCHRK